MAKEPMNITKQRLKLIKDNEKQRLRILALEDMNLALTNENLELEAKYKLELDKHNGLLLFLSDYLFSKTNNVFKYENAIKEQINEIGRASCRERV